MRQNGDQNPSLVEIRHDFLSQDLDLVLSYEQIL